MRVKLGKRYRDKVTGFEGIAISLHDYLQGCRRVSLERLGSEGDKIITLAFDEPNLEEVDAGVRVPVGAGRTGGPHDHATPGGAH